jgi:hypothetical protein
MSRSIISSYGYEEFKHDVFITEADIEEIENEEQNTPLTLLEHIDRIIKIHFSIQNHLNEKEKKVKYEEILNRHLKSCSNILGITALQALLFSYIVNVSGAIILENLAKYLKVTRVQGFKYLDDLDVLVNKRLIKKSNRGFESDFKYWVPFEVIQSLREGKTFTPPRFCNLSKDEFFIRLMHLFTIYYNEERRSIEEFFLIDFTNLLDDNIHLEFVKNIYKLSLTKPNLVFLSFLRTQFYKEQKDVFPISFAHIFDNLENTEEKTDLDKLLELKLIEYSGDDYKDKDNIVLTHKTLIELLGINEAMLKSEKDSELINHKNILKKELFYNENNTKQIEQLTGLFIEKNFINVRERLKLKGMRTGFSCLFFGAPGTGKTETAYQIARISGRDIMPIDISMTKSHWFGESEKIIKDIFTQYHHRVKRANNINLPVPILLLNEADAIINKRKDTSISSVAQTENAIQNIILEQLKKLDGILIATTNLTENIDTAFERRFIYKIEFQKPDINVRQSIWKSHIPELTETETLKLTENFELSGGQIENIARKRAIMSIINGKDPDLSELITFCGNESILKTEVKVGF